MIGHLFYIGNNRADHATEMDVKRAFEHLGWTVEMMHEQDFSKSLTDTRGAWQELRAKATNADLVLQTLTQGTYPSDERVLALWEACRNASVPTASIHLDLFYGLSSPKDSGPQRCELPRLHPMFRVDYVFTADGGHQAAFERDGVNHYWLPPGVRHDQARDIEPTDEDRAKWAGFDVAFVGSTGYHQEYPQRNELVVRLREQYGPRFVHVGNGGDRCNNSDEPNLRGEPLNRMYRTIPVIVGDSCFAATSQRYWSDRITETWGRGGYLLHPYMDAHVEVFGRLLPGWWAGDYPDLFAAIDLALAEPERREAERVEIATMIRAEHTYVNKVQSLLDTIYGTG